MGGLSKNRVKQALKSIFRVQTWKLLLVLVPLLFLAATLLRFDHLGMVELRDKVIEADESGSDEDITIALENLQKYTSTHIVINIVEENGGERVIFGTGRFYLENQYIRKAQEELRRAEESLENAGENPNGNVFKKAAEVCDAKALQYGWGFNSKYIDCMTEELAKYPSMDEIDDYIQAMIPPTALYRREYVSPIWYPSWAGFIILLCLVLAVVIIIRLVIWIVLRITLFTLKKR